VKRALLLMAMLALGAIGLTLAQVGSAAAPDDCGATKTNGTVTFEDLIIQAAPDAPAGCRKKPEPLVNTPDGIFLCYSTSQVEPGVWMQDQAAELLAAGYYYPKALPGNVDGGTNLGSFHLVCNASGTPTGMFVNENGEVIPPEHAQGNLGYYPQLS
jgi:hypothetical protein